MLGCGIMVTLILPQSKHFPLIEIFHCIIMYNNTQLNYVNKWCDIAPSGKYLGKDGENF